MLSPFSRVWPCDLMDWSLLGSSVHGTLQARILEWIALPSSKGSSPTEESNPHLLCLPPWQAGSLPLAHLIRWIALADFQMFSDVKTTLCSCDGFHLLIVYNSFIWYGLGLLGFCWGLLNLYSSVVLTYSLLFWAYSFLLWCCRHSFGAGDTGLTEWAGSTLSSSTFGSLWRILWF